jgi:hypothetical protein
MYIWFFYKIKKPCRAGPTLQSEAITQAPHDARARLAQSLLNGSYLGPARQTRPIWPSIVSIPPHDNDGPRFSCHHLVHYSTSFLCPLMPPPPRHPILGRGRRSMRLLPIFVRHQPNTESRSGYCTSTRTFHIMCAPSERKMCPWAISKYFDDLVSNTSA